MIDIPREQLLRVEAMSIGLPSVAFRVPTRAAHALDTAALCSLGLALGLARGSVSIAAVTADATDIELHCSVPMAFIVVEALREIGVAATEDGPLLIAAARGLKAALDALDIVPRLNVRRGDVD